MTTLRLFICNLWGECGETRKEREKGGREKVRWGERVVWVRGGSGEGDRDMQQTKIKTFEYSF